MKTVKLGRHGNQEEAAAIAVDFLMNGGVVVMPTDTSYALAADATNPEAVARIFELKGRPADKPLAVMVPDREAAEKLAVFSPEAARLWTAFMPGPLTLVLPLLAGASLPATLTAGGRSIGLRCPRHGLALLTAERLERPYTATSANRAGAPAAFTVEEFLDELPDEVTPHCVIDAGPLPIVPVSTVVAVSDTVEVLREGAIPAEQIRQAAG